VGGACVQSQGGASMIMPVISFDNAFNTFVKGDIGVETDGGNLKLS
jgi:hypothetical protein